VRENNVLATGGLLAAIALLALAAVAPVFRKADPPPWTTRGWVAELTTLAIVCTLALGLGYLGAGALAAFQTKPESADLGLLAGVVLVAIVIWRGLKARAGAAGPRTPARADLHPHGERRARRHTALQAAPGPRGRGRQPGRDLAMTIAPNSSIGSRARTSAAGAPILLLRTKPCAVSA
jgi:hypothetical protein